MLNVVILIGRLTKDPELRYTANGTPVIDFTIAVDRPYTNQKGEREADFIRIVAWRKLAENCANNLSKGRLIAVHGRLQTRSYEDQNGQRKYTTEVIADRVQFLDRPKTDGSPAIGSNDLEGDLGFDIPSDDEVPF